MWIIAGLWNEWFPVYNTGLYDPSFAICPKCPSSRYNATHATVYLDGVKVDYQTITVSSSLLTGLVDALRCVQWVLWLTCLSVLDCCALDSVGQETPSTERHEHSHPSRGGHGQHLVPGHGCRLRVSRSLPVCPFTLIHHHYLFVSFWHFYCCISREKQFPSHIFHCLSSQPLPSS